MDKIKLIESIIDIDKIRELQNRNLKVELIGTWIWVTGHTYPYKDLLKKYNFKYQKNKKAWSYHKGNRYYKKSKKDYTMEQLRFEFDAEKRRNSYTKKAIYNS